MATSKTKRARALWLRSERSRTLHGICGLFDRERTSADLSGAQEWLYDRCIQELERRHQATPRLLERCWCAYCVAPFLD